MTILKSIPCRDFLFLMDQEEDPKYEENIRVIIESFKKRWITINKEKLEEEINLYI